MHKTIQGDSVPALGLGTWQLEGDDCTRAVEHALELGYRHIDTAQIYGNEAEVGRGLRRSAVDRDAIFLVTKVWLENLEPEAVHASTEESLRRLGVEYVDLLLVHWPSEEVPLEQTLEALAALQAQGRTRHIGVSNFTPRLLQQAIDHAPVFANQVEYHPYLSQTELLEMVRERDVLLTAYTPLARGRVMDDPTIRDVAEAHGKTPAQVTLRWLLQQDHVAAIPKAASAEHRAANFDVFDFTLTDDEMQRLTRLARGRRFIDPEFAPDWGG